ncbi:MAG TPA: hypothetical protein VF221_02275 [Chloroflexota bacterium]
MSRHFPTSRIWLGLPWTAWMPLMAAHPLALAQLPSGSGLYRIRFAGRDGEILWLGWAESGVRETVERLSRQVHLPVEPYDDPRAPAHLLWTMRRKTRVSFEVSGLEIDPLDHPAIDQMLLEARQDIGLH